MTTDKSRRMWDIDPNFPKEKAENYIKELIQKFKRVHDKDTQLFSTAHIQEKI